MRCYQGPLMTPRHRDYKYAVLSYIEKINERDVPGLSGLITDDFQLVDPFGKTVNGREATERSWKELFKMFPDYEITVQHILQNENLVSVVGTAKGTYAVKGRLLPENSWQVPAAWKAVVKKGQVAEWRVFMDIDPVKAIMSKYPIK